MAPKIAEGGVGCGPQTLTMPISPQPEGFLHPPAPPRTRVANIRVPTGRAGPSAWRDPAPCLCRASSSHLCKWEIKTLKESLTEATGFNRHPCLLDEMGVTPRSSPGATGDFGGFRLSLHSPFGIPEHTCSGQDLRLRPFAKAPACNH